MSRLAVHTRNWHLTRWSRHETDCVTLGPVSLQSVCNRVLRVLCGISLLSCFSFSLGNTFMMLWTSSNIRSRLTLLMVSGRQRIILHRHWTQKEQSQGTVVKCQLMFVTLLTFMTSSENMGGPAVVTKLSCSNTSRALQRKKREVVHRLARATASASFRLYFARLLNICATKKPEGATIAQIGHCIPWLNYSSLTHELTLLHADLIMFVSSDVSRTLITSRLTDLISCCPSSMSSTLASRISVIRPCIRSFSTPIDASLARDSIENN